MGLTINEVAELIDYIQQNNSWYNMHNNHKHNRLIFKYYDMKFDTRTGLMWGITFRKITNGKKTLGTDEVFIRTDNAHNFKDEIYKFLNTEIKEIL